MAQQIRERAHRRLGFRARKAVAVGGIIAIISLGTIGASNMQAGGLSISRALSPDAIEPGEPSVQQSPDGGEPLLLQEVVVHIDGAVAHPGVYGLSGETVRIRDAVEAAGGLTSGADTSAINLAQPISDGMKVHIPDEGEQVVAPVTGWEDPSAALINLNSAGIQELMELPGVGERTAQAICDNRNEFGPFTSIDDLMRVSGIGEKKLEKIRPYVCI